MTVPILTKREALCLAVALICFAPALIADSLLFEVLDRDESGYIILEETEDNPEVRLFFSDLDQNKNDRLEETELELSGLELSFEHMDVNEDLVINYDEALELPPLSEAFERLDINNDQELTPDEFENFMTPAQTKPMLNSAEPSFDELDVNQDLAISNEEASELFRLRRNFSQLDENNDGELTREEFTSFVVPGENELGLGNTEPSLEELDINEDLTISQEEASEHFRLSQNFSQLDENNDQELTREEFADFADLYE